MPAWKAAFGDLVVCAGGEHAAAFGIGGRAGIVVETRRNDARVLYLDPERSVWLPHASLKPAPPEETAGSPLALAADLSRALNARSLEATLLPGTGGSCRLVIAHGAVTLDLVEAIRRRLEGRLGAWALRPAGLHRMESVIEIRS